MVTILLHFVLFFYNVLFLKAWFLSKDTWSLQGYLPLAKHQSRLGLCVVVAGGRAADEHGGATVATEGVLQDAGHFAVTIRHVRFLKERGRGGERKREDGGGRAT